jgi:hypothetical protein
MSKRCTPPQKRSERDPVRDMEKERGEWDAERNGPREGKQESMWWGYGGRGR